MANSILTAIRFEWRLDTGDAGNGYKVYSYEAGSTDPKSTFPTATSVSPNPWPVVLDSDGRANIWLVNGETYKIIVHDADDVPVPGASVDNISSSPSSGAGSGNLRGTLTAGTVPVASGSETMIDSSLSQDIDGNIILATGKNLFSDAINTNGINAVVSGSLIVGADGISTIGNTSTGSLQVTGTAFFNSGIQLGGDILPTSSGTRSLGVEFLKMLDGWFSGNVSIDGNIILGGNSVDDILISTDTDSASDTSLITAGYLDAREYALSSDLSDYLALAGGTRTTTERVIVDDFGGNATVYIGDELEESPLTVKGDVGYHLDLRRSDNSGLLVNIGLTGMSFLHHDGTTSAQFMAVNDSEQVTFPNLLTASGGINATNAIFDSTNNPVLDCIRDRESANSTYATVNKHTAKTTGTATGTFGPQLQFAYEDALGETGLGWLHFQHDGKFIIRDGSLVERLSLDLSSGLLTASDGIVSNGLNVSTVAYAGIHCHDASTAQSIATGATYTKLTAYTDNSLSENCTPDFTNDKITITKAGVYEVLCEMSAVAGTANLNWFATVFLNGVEQNQIHWKRKITNSSDTGSMSMSGTVDVTTVPWDLDVRIRHDGGSNANFTVSYSNFSAKKIGDT